MAMAILPEVLDFQWLTFLVKIIFLPLDSFWSVVDFDVLLFFCLNWLSMLDINKTPKNHQQIQSTKKRFNSLQNRDYATIFKKNLMQWPLPKSDVM